MTDSAGSRCFLSTVETSERSVGAFGYIGSLGALAQLGERLVCNQEVTGSIPVRSIDLRNATLSGTNTRAHRRALESKQLTHYDLQP